MSKEKKENVTGKKEGKVGIQMPKVDFSTFMASLSSSALVHLGQIEEPTTNKKEKNLPMAKHTIDIIAMLQEKTKNNLSKHEDVLIQTILTDLKIRYVKEIS